MLLSSSASMMDGGTTCWCRDSAMHEDLNELLTKVTWMTSLRGERGRAASWAVQGLEPDPPVPEAVTCPKSVQQVPGDSSAKDLALRGHRAGPQVRSDGTATFVLHGQDQGRCRHGIQAGFFLLVLKQTTIHTSPREVSWVLGAVGMLTPASRVHPGPGLPGSVGWPKRGQAGRRTGPAGRKSRQPAGVCEEGPWEGERHLASWVYLTVIRSMGLTWSISGNR